MIDKDGNLIPSVFGIGNHDVGANAMSGLTNIRRDISFYFAFFPQNYPISETTGEVEYRVPQLKERKTYSKFIFGEDAIVYEFDFQYLESLKLQGEWVRKDIHKYEHYPVKLAFHHNSIYSAC